MDTRKFQLLFYYYRALHPSIHVTALLPLAQAVHESANFTSHVFDANNNCMGMTAPQSRDSTALNRGGKGYAMYSSPADGIADIFYWLEAFGLTDDVKLDAFLQSGRYATDKQYYAKVQKQVAAQKAAGNYIDPLLIYAGATAAGIAAAVGVGALVNHAMKS
jgi:Mannosyl-glycoprotein endo-beta-N-acetylglucosaminidase